jgi:endonuclease/exonuclease/phosphatase family metal-dependent hydrolase
VPFDVAATVREFGADVVVLAEAWRPHGEACALDALAADGYAVEELRFTTLHFTPRSKVAVPGDGWWVLAVASRFPVVGRRELPLGRAPADRVGRRSALALRLDVDGTDLEVVALHVSSQIYYGGPVFHLARLRRQLPRDVPAIVAGDCNLWGPAVVRLFPGWRRAVRGRTFPAHRPHSQIDHVLVNDRVEILGGEVLPADHSDHRPVRARLRLT